MSKKSKLSVSERREVVLRMLRREEPVAALAQAALPVALKERSALEPNAEVETAGRCPHCGSEGVYLEKQVTEPEVRSLYGPVVVRKQHGRCRSCGGPFSPFRFVIGDYLARCR